MTARMRGWCVARNNLISLSLGGVERRPFAFQQTNDLGSHIYLFLFTFPLPPPFFSFVVFSNRSFRLAEAGAAELDDEDDDDDEDDGGVLSVLSLLSSSSVATSGEADILTSAAVCSFL